MNILYVAFTRARAAIRLPEAAGEVGRSMLRTVDAVREGEWAGVEG